MASKKAKDAWLSYADVLLSDYFAIADLKLSKPQRALVLLLSDFAEPDCRRGSMGRSRRTYKSLERMGLVEAGLLTADGRAYLAANPPKGELSCVCTQSLALVWLPKTAPRAVLLAKCRSRTTTKKA